MPVGFEHLIEELREDEKEHECSKLPEDTARRYSTEHRYNQYMTGEITEEEYNSYASKRFNNALQRKLQKDIHSVESISHAPDLAELMIGCEFNAQRNVKCSVTVFDEDGNRRMFHGHAAGYGYDKESSAVAEALDQSDSVLKALYLYKDLQLAKGDTDHSYLAICGHDNRDIIAYGAGYGVLPYFEGAVGVECFWNIFDKLGFTVAADYSAKHSNFYHVYRKDAKRS